MRIVSLCPSLTELVFDLGLGNALVGRTKFCVHPADEVAVVPSVGGTKNPRIDRIVATSPDLVLMNEEENRIEDARALEAAGVPVHTSMPRTAEDTAAMVRSIGAALAVVGPAESMAADIERRAARVRAAAQGRPPVTYAYLIWREPWMTVNADTFIAELLGMPGGINVFADNAERYPTVTLSAVAAATPAVILLPSEPFPFAEKHIVELSEQLRCSAGRFMLVDGELLSWHGSRTPRGIDYAESVIVRAGQLRSQQPT
ncbi:MAG: helical backbone metal receptor [Gemmatimonadaceae bacterium]